MAPSNLFKMFGRSPIRPLQKHMAKGHASVKELIGFFSHVMQRDWEQAAVSQEAITRIENEADEIKQDLRAHLPKNLFLPVPRQDVLQLLTMQDRIPNKAKDIAGLVLGRKMHLPEAIAPSYLDLLKRCSDATELTHKAINEIDELLESGFSGSEIHIIEDMIHKISQIEHETDEIQIKVRSELFAIENDLSPVDVIFLYKVIDWTGDIGDRAEQVANRLQLLLAR